MFKKKKVKIKGYRIYGDLVYQHRPTIRSLILDLLYQKFVKREKAKLSIYREDASFQTPISAPTGINAKHIAIIVDGKVVELLKMHTSAAERLLSKKSKLIEFNPEDVTLKIGMDYPNDKKDKNEKD